MNHPFARPLALLLAVPLGTHGSTVDASHTLIAGWSDTTGLTPAVTSLPVPETSPLAPYAPGLAAMAAAARRHRG